MDGSLPGSSVHGVLQPRILEWVAVPFSRDLPNPGIEPTSLTSPALAGEFFTTSTTWEACSSLFLTAVFPGAPQSLLFSPGCSPSCALFLIWCHHTHHCSHLVWVSLSLCLIAPEDPLLQEVLQDDSSPDGSPPPLKDKPQLPCLPPTLALGHGQLLLVPHSRARHI